VKLIIKIIACLICFLMTFTLIALALPISRAQVSNSIFTFYPTENGTTSIKAQFFYLQHPEVNEKCYSLQLDSLVKSANGTIYLYQNVLDVYWTLSWIPPLPNSNSTGTWVNLPSATWGFRECSSQGNLILSWSRGISHDIANYIISDFGASGNGLDCIELGFGSGGLGKQASGMWINVIYQMALVYSGINELNETGYSTPPTYPTITDFMDTQAIVTGCNSLDFLHFYTFPSVTFTQAQFLIAVSAPVNLSVRYGISQAEETNTEVSNLLETPLTGYPCQNICYSEYL
jgi:hypothetical protein